MVLEQQWSWSLRSHSISSLWVPAMLRSAPWYCLISHHLESKCYVCGRGMGRKLVFAHGPGGTALSFQFPSATNRQTDRQTPAQLITSLCQLTSGRQTLDSTVKIRLEKGRLKYIFSRTFTFWKLYQVNSVSHLITPWIKGFPNKFLFTSSIEATRAPCLLAYTLPGWLYPLW